MVASCTHCRQTTLGHGGINPRGLRPNQIWQQDITVYEPFKPQKYLHVTIDTYSGYIYPTAETKSNATATIRHLCHAISILGIPQEIKTDNGPNYVTSRFREFLNK